MGLVRGPLTINGELNDVRPAGSQPLEWWYQTAIRIVPKRPRIAMSASFRPLSFHYMWSPGRLDISDQSTMVNTFKAPTDRSTFIWYTGKMHFNATLVRGKVHTHNTLFNDTFLFAATPEDLGLADGRFHPQGLFGKAY